MSALVEVPTDAQALPTDWRGTPIEVGNLVVYGASVGRSVTLVEATVEGFTKSGRVNLKVVRRSYGSSDTKSVVHVGADRLTIVTELPPTEVPTQAEVSAERTRRFEEMQRIRATHPESRRNPNSRGMPYFLPCERCGIESQEMSRQECVSNG